MRLEVRDSGAIGLRASGKANLGAGQQTLTASIPAAALRRRFKDGPWTISGVEIFRPEGNTLGDSVATGNLTLKTAPYKRDHWDRGEAWSDEEVTVRGIYPANSGHFRMVEVELNVTTPGGTCSWMGSLNMDRYENPISSPMVCWPKEKLRSASYSMARW